MAITSVGYDGPVTEAQWANAISRIGVAKYGVAGYDDWKVTAASGTDRGVSVNVGSGWGTGVYDTSDTNYVIQLPTVPSGSRYDLIVAKRNWAGTGGVTTFDYIQGAAGRNIPDGWAGVPGVLAYQPLALVKVTAGQSTVQEIVDLRCYAQPGGLFINDVLALNYLQELGAAVKLRNGPLYICELDATGNTIFWGKYNINAKAISYGGGPYYREPANSGALNRVDLFRINIPDPGFPYHVHIDVVVEATGGGAGTRWDVIATWKGGWVVASRGDAVAPWWTLSGTTTGAPTVGAGYVELFAWKQFGSGNFGLSQYNQFISATVLPA